MTGKKKSIIKKWWFILGCIALVVMGFILFRLFLHAPIKVGILHSLTGELASSEKPVVDAELLAIEKINKAGGINGSKLIPIIVDGKSDHTVFALEAERLITKEKVDVIFGAWSSRDRKAIKDVVEKYNHLLVYPVSFEGLEESSSIFYAGATVNQQIIPAVIWSYHHLGKRFFLVGAETIFPRAAEHVIKRTIKIMNGEFLGSMFIPFNSTDVEPIIDHIMQIQPDVIINTLYGLGSTSLFRGLRKRGITPEKLPIMNISNISEVEFAHFGESALAGDYVTASYFQTIENEQNARFITDFKKRFGADRVLSEAQEAGYIGVNLWAQAARSAGSSKPELAKKHLLNQVFHAPEGLVYVDDKQLLTWKMIYVGKLRHDGQFTIVWDSKKSIEPLMYPIFDSKQNWQELIMSLYQQWGNQWTLTVP